MRVYVFRFVSDIACGVVADSVCHLFLLSEQTAKPHFFWSKSAPPAINLLSSLRMWFMYFSLQIGPDRISHHDKIGQEKTGCGCNGSRNPLTCSAWFPGNYISPLHSHPLKRSFGVSGDLPENFNDILFSIGSIDSGASIG